MSHRSTIAAQSAKGTGIDLISENIALVCRPIMVEGQTLRGGHLAHVMKREGRKLNLFFCHVQPQTFPHLF